MRFSLFSTKNKVYCNFGESNILDVTSEYESLKCVAAKHFGTQYARIGKQTKSCFITKTDDVYRFCDEHVGRGRYWITCNGTPVRRTVPWEEYYNGCPPHIEVHLRLKGGSPVPLNPLFTTYSYSVEIENALIRARYTSLEILDLPLPLEEKQTLVGLTHEQIVQLCRNASELQADGNDEADAAWHVMMVYVQKNIANMFRYKLMPGSDKSFSQIFDGLFILWHWKSKCSCIADYYQLARTAYMCFTGKSPTDATMAYLFPAPETQGFEEIIGGMRTIYTNFEECSDSKLARKLRKMWSFLLAQGILSQAGLDMKEAEFEFLQKKSNLRFQDKTSFLMHVFDTAIFVCERIIAYRKTGNIDSFIRDGTECDNWVLEADRVLALAAFTSNLGPHGTTYFKFMSDLNDLIDQGQVMARAFRSAGADKTNPITRKLASLLFLKNSEVTKRSSMQSRDQPFGVLVYGHSGVAKSSFVRVLYHAFGSIFGLERDDHYLYTRSPASEYWDNFDSSMWAIQLDDIAFIKPSAANEIDPTLKELLNVVNNVPYTPPQAALEDKGKTPIMSKLVIATTNCEHLNAYEYFHCPLAVRRRLPYVIEVTPKPNLLKTEGIFIDPDKIPEATIGYPDYWLITVKKLIPVIEQDGTERARLEVVAEFSDITEFVRHFGAAAKQHFVNQTKGATVENYVKQVDLCPSCCYYKDSCQCQLQFEEDSVCGAIVLFCTRVFISWYTWWLSWMVTWSWFCSSLVWCVKWSLFKRVIHKFCLNLLPVEHYQRIMRRVAAMPRNDRLCAGLLVLSCLSTACGLYLCVTEYRNIQKKMAQNEHSSRSDGTESKVEDTTQLSEESEDCNLQGNVHGTTEDDFIQEKTQNVWYRESIELSNFDLPISATSLSGIEGCVLRDMFSRNVVNIHIKPLEGKSVYTRGFFYKGQHLVFNAHTLKGQEFELRILRGANEDGVKPVIVMRAQRKDFKFSTVHDLCTLRVYAMAPARSLDKFWAEKRFPVSKLIGFGRDKAGSVGYREVHAVNFMHMPLEGLEGEHPLFTGVCSEETKSGDCGTLYMAYTPKGASFVGFHVAGHEHRAAIIQITRSELDELCDVGEIDISGDGAPSLSLQDEAVPLLTPHSKSVMRFLEHGSAEQFGRLPGFQVKPRSKVCSTPLREEFEKHHGNECEFWKPAMDGWEPIRNNVKDMVVPVVNYDRQVLDECKRAFLADIVAGLPEGWESQLVEVSDEAAVNGLPGVKFIDKINTNSSMGFPWNKTKKQFLVEKPTERHPHGVDFDEDFWARVRKIEKVYKEGRRSYPIYMAHLKDEARKRSKIRAKSTRLFAGGPADWGIVVRKKLISFVKLLQENKYTFEAGPGTVCQSIEWQQMREYLVQHGVDRIVAGDYSKFDKHMIADFILAAFWIIAELHRIAGHDDEYVTSIMGIAHDVAFPMMNVKGELVMFYGTNPSGHPLTVVINSIVNSLYMRYSYRVVGYELDTFKKNVALITYGDDNTMGVSPRVPLFNHTAIQAVLEKIGVSYTMADKESESVPYIHINDVAFLKRKWRFDEDVGAYVCPLEEESINKSLCVWVPSGTIPPEQQMIEVMKAAVNEYFWYGKERFEIERKFILGLAQKEPFVFYVSDHTFPTWQELFERFWGVTC